MIRFLAALSTLCYQILRVPQRKLKKKIKGFDFRRTVWFRGERIEISLNCHNLRNIFVIEENLVYSIIVPSSCSFRWYFIFGGWKLENLNTTFFWPHQMWRHNMTFWHFFHSWNDQDNYPRQCAKFGKKCAKSANLS